MKIKNKIKKLRDFLFYSCRLYWLAVWFKFIFGLKSEAIDVPIPWITFGAKDWLEKNLHNEMRVFEWGGGGSTLYIAQKVKHITSVEHDKRWWMKVCAYLRLNKISNCEFLMIEPEHDLSATSRINQFDFRSNSEQFANYTFKKYCRAIDKYEDNFFDLIIVDGRARPTCVQHAIKKVSVGGYLLLDDSERSTYASALDLCKDFERIDFCGAGPYLDYQWCTSILKRIK